MNEFISCVTEKFCCFSGRARRREYWMFTLFYILVLLGLFIVAQVIPAFSFAYFICPLVLLLPSLGVTVRRLHDIGKSGWLILVGLIPFVGGIILLIFECLDSTPGENQYGPNPKGL